jgi:hypothetical protein
MTLSPCAAALMPSTICVADSALEMKPCAPLSRRFLCDRGVVREAEQDDRAVRRIRSEVPRTLTHLLYLAVRVEESRVNRALWFSLDVEFDDADLRLIGAQ